MSWRGLRRVAGLVAAVAVLADGVSGTEPEPTRFFFEMVKVPAGEYWVGKYEVTQKQYEEITGENPSRFQGADRPVDSVSWDDAVAFCEKLTARERAAGRLPGDYAYDLPTDAQWDQFAAGTEVKGAVLSLTQTRTGSENVGTAPANPYGLCDVVGNVWEWCRDWYNNDVRKKDSNRDLPGLPVDAGAAAAGPEETFKVLRGGSWDTGPSDGFRLDHRLRYAPGMSNYRTGFRCVVVRTGGGKG